MKNLSNKLAQSLKVLVVITILIANPLLVFAEEELIDVPVSEDILQTDDEESLVEETGIEEEIIEESEDLEEGNINENMEENESTEEIISDELIEDTATTEETDVIDETPAEDEVSNPDISVDVIIGDSLNIENFNITLPYSCTIGENTFQDYKAICVLEVLKTLGEIEDYQTTYWESYSAWTLDSINEIGNTIDWSSYWSIWYNQGWANSIDSQTLEDGSELTFYYGGYFETYPSLPEEKVDTTVIVFDGNSLVEFEIEVSESCTIGENTFDGYKVICALEELKNLENIDNYQTTYWESYNAWTLDSINDIANAVDWSSYWSIWYNQGWANSIDSQSLEDNSELTFFYGGYSETYPVIDDNEEVEDPEENENSNDLGDDENEDEYNVENAIEYILSFQKPSGQIGEVYETDWAFIALGSVSGYSQEKNMARDYLKSNTNVGDVTSSYARRSMALMSLGISPYDGTAINYIEKIVKNLEKEGIENQQLGTLTFAGIVLLKSGYNKNDGIIAKISDRILAKQNSNGAFAETVGDYTGPALEYFALLKDSKFDDQVSKAIQYLEDAQESNGGFGDPYTTGWNTNGLISQGLYPDKFKFNEKSIGDYFAQIQDENGAVVDSTGGVWATTYSVVGMNGKSWSEVLKNYEKPEKIELQPEVKVESASSSKDPTISNPPQQSQPEVYGISTESTKENIVETTPTPIPTKQSEYDNTDSSPIREKISSSWTIYSILSFTTLGAGIFFRRIGL